MEVRPYAHDADKIENQANLIVTNTILEVHLYWQERKIMGRKFWQGIGKTERKADGYVINFKVHL